MPLQQEDIYGKLKQYAAKLNIDIELASLDLTTEKKMWVENMCEIYPKFDFYNMSDKWVKMTIQEEMTIIERITKETNERTDEETINELNNNTE
jgi:hypothetical protein